MSLAWIGAAVGGVGLFLLGVRLMTEGLKVAAGRALGRMLRRATASRLRALATGVGLTALVQSSSAVTVATIGFVNAGLLGLGEALWVVFGSNVGTSATGWLVALTGVDLDIEAYALPMIGLGALARALDRTRRLGALAEALAGLGLFFLGLSILGEAFGQLAEIVDLGDIGAGLLGQLGLFVAGVGLTVAMQSSSAAIAVTLSAAATGVIDLQGAGAMVIGANLGTTSTAALAVIGATPAARRTAAGHVAFNLLAAVVAFALLPWLLRLIQLVLQGGDGDAPVAVAPTLAFFHTAFNVLGIVLIWPLAGRLERALAKRWVTKDEERSKPRYLDRNVMAVPEVGAQALAREMGRLGRHATEIVGEALRKKSGSKVAIERRSLAYDNLGLAISKFAAELSRQALADPVSRTLARLLRARRHYDTAVEQARILVDMRAELREEDEALAALDDELADSMRDVAHLANPEAKTFSLGEAQSAVGRMQERYDKARTGLLEGATRGELPVRAAVMSQHLLAESRRAVRHLVRGAQDLIAAVEPAE